MSLVFDKTILRSLFDEGSSTRRQFLCVCDLLSDEQDKDDVTFTELQIWSDYIMKASIRPLFKQGKRVFTAFRKSAESEDGKELRVLVGHDLLLEYNYTDISTFVSFMRNWKKEAISRSQPNLLEEDQKVVNLWNQFKENIRLSVIQSLSITEIRSYCLQDQTQVDLLGLGDIFEVLGRNAGVLLEQKNYSGIIQQYVGLFSESIATRSQNSTPMALKHQSKPGVLIPLDF